MSATADGVGSADASASTFVDARNADVFAALLDPAQIEQWYGPPGTHVEPGSVTVDAREGGSLRLNLVSDDEPGAPERVEWSVTGIDENKLLTATEQVGDQTLTLRIETHFQSGGTRVELAHGPIGSPEGAAAISRAWQHALDRLAGLFGSDAP